MKKLLMCGVIFFSSFHFSQTVKELIFDSNVPDSENNYVAVPREKTEEGYGFGYVYFDESAGYTYRIIGSLKEENGKLKVIDNEKTGIQIQRIANLAYKSAKIPPSMVKKLGYPQEPDWLKNYKSNASENEKQLNRANKMNGAKFSNLALPKLQKLYNSGYKTPEVYFELAFAQNVLKDFVSSEKITAEAIKSKIADDLVYKEHVFSLLNQSKISDAEKFVQNNLKSYKNEANKAESIINLIAFSNHFKQKDVAKKWLGIFKQEIKSTRYNQYIEQLEKLINSNDSTPQ